MGKKKKTGKPAWIIEKENLKCSLGRIIKKNKTPKLLPVNS